MTKKTSFKRHLLASASVLAIGTFAAGQAEAAALAATGNAANTGNFDLDSSITLGEAVSDNSADGDELINLNSGSTLTTGAFTLARTNGNAVGADVLLTTASATSDTNVIVSVGGVITHDDETGGAHAIDIDHTIGTITNLGKITTTATNGDLITLATGVTASIVNGDDSSTAASITATGTGEAIVVEGTLTGSITNKAGALISGAASNAGLIDVDGAITGGITNAGSITVTGAGLALDIGAGVSSGVTNSGTISGATGAGLVNVSGASTVNVTNTGSISASSTGTAVDVEAKITGTITNGADGTATSLISAVGGVGIDLGADVTGGVVNWGSITETTGKAIDVTAAVATGGVDNKAGAIIKATTGEAIDLGANLVGNITNAGTIQSAAGTAIITTAASDFDLTNTGTIQDTGTGIALQVTTGAVTGTITNSGLIASNGGVVLDFNHDLSGGITNTGTIQSVTGNVNAISVLGGTADVGTITNGNSTTAGTITASGSAATIDFTNAGVSISGIVNTKGTISNTGTGSAIQVATGGTGQLSGATGVITNAGTISSIGADTLLIADIDGTITNSGTISATGTGAVSAITLTAITGANLTSSQVINNSGVITAAGTTDTIDFGEAAAAGTIVNSGTITNTGSGSVLDLSGETGHAITITNSGNITAALATTAAIAGGGGDDVLNWNGGTITGTIDLGSETGDTINVGDAAADSLSTGGTIGGTSQLQVKFGTFGIGHNVTLVNATEADEDLIFDTGTTANVTESVTLHAGDVDVNGTLQVAAGKTATISSTTTGTVDISGKVKIDLSAYDGTTATIGKIVNTTGSNTFNFVNGSTIDLNITATNYVAAGTIADVITSDAITAGGSTIDGNESNVSCTDNSYVLSCSVATATDATGLDITLTRTNAYNSSSSLAQVKAVGVALEAIGQGGNAALDTIVGSLDVLTTAAAVEGAIATLNPNNVVSGSTTQSAIAVADAAVGTVENRMQVARAGYDEATVATGGHSNNSGAWGEIFGSSIDQGWREGVEGYQADVAGFTLGADTAVNSNLRVGGAFSYANTDAEGNTVGTGGSNKTEVDSFQLSAYGTYDMGKTYVEGIAALTLSDYESSRTLFDGSVAQGDFDGQQYSLKATVGHRLDIEGGLKVTPFVSAQYAFVTQDSYTETGSNANLTVDTDDVNVFKTGLGTNVAYPIASGGTTYVPRLSAAWYYDLVGDEVSSTNNFTSATGTTFVTEGADVAQSAFKLGAGLDILAQDNLTLSFDYDWEAKEDYDAHTGALKARFSF